eukprot:CAMPEP_0119130640 /NCGR_PEP_ID=MMETSP1310-20130426/8292_1 /TAXON_ID=464262 /ORGANISM="Genus nov. species nov., Strain RCC2339" /LENGTH=132 /DNA_ID=CAMNT_0007121165 /DNA_START=66 /DNA_END=464 /DNA_ORIENTATION=+
MMRVALTVFAAMVVAVMANEPSYAVVTETGTVQNPGGALTINVTLGSEGVFCIGQTGTDGKFWPWATVLATAQQNTNVYDGIGLTTVNSVVGNECYPYGGVLVNTFVMDPKSGVTKPMYIPFSILVADNYAN